ncbi:MAG TPA: polysaccharide deacetylase family protein [Gammaproteobacteria bacterium]|nr:polysaccharide deacetylase family protein [Gammaproteobacteria bacterium]
MNKILKTITYSLLSRFIIKRGNKSSVYITFDDGPHPDNTPKIIELLKNFNVKATFFMTGSEMEKYPEVVKMVATSGHTIGYHSYTHASYKKMSILKIINELSSGRSIARKSGVSLRLFRPPYGDLKVISFLYLIITGWRVVMWSLDSRDSFDSKDKVLETIDPKKIIGGDILLFHDDYEMTLEILPVILKKYSKNNIRCSPL